jgi:hypothetical protein
MFTYNKTRLRSKRRKPKRKFRFYGSTFAKLQVTMVVGVIIAISTAVFYFTSGGNNAGASRMTDFQIKAICNDSQHLKNRQDLNLPFEIQILNPQGGIIGTIYRDSNNNPLITPTVAELSVGDKVRIILKNKEGVEMSRDTVSVNNQGTKNFTIENCEV